jgi:hypothetical protein
MSPLRVLALVRSRPLPFLVVAALMGAVAGYIVFLVTKLPSIHLFTAVGALIGFSAAAIYLLARGRVRIAELQVGFPQTGQATFMVDSRDQEVAWQLFVEIMTRVATQRLEAEQGFAREALSSLYGFFGTTRELLKGMSPSQANRGPTVESEALAMLNLELRPFLSKWHPLLKAFESREPKQDEREWERNAEFRFELELLRQRLLRYARNFGELAEVSQLDILISGDDENAVSPE